MAQGLELGFALGLLTAGALEVVGIPGLGTAGVQSGHHHGEVVAQCRAEGEGVRARLAADAGIEVERGRRAVSRRGQIRVRRVLLVIDADVAAFAPGFLPRVRRQGGQREQSREHQQRQHQREALHRKLLHGDFPLKVTILYPK